MQAISINEHSYNNNMEMIVSKGDAIMLVKRQLDNVITNLLIVQEKMQVDDYRRAYQAMDYETLDGFGKNLEELVSSLDD